MAKKSKSPKRTAPKSSGAAKKAEEKSIISKKTAVKVAGKSVSKKNTPEKTTKTSEKAAKKPEKKKTTNSDRVNWTKTTPAQRWGIIAVAALMLFSIVASFVVVATGSNSSSDSEDPTETALYKKYYAEYESKSAEVDAAAAELSDTYASEFSSYQSEVTAYNETSANEGGVQTEDLKPGSGRELTEGDNDYFAYYIGWCADETIFDSSITSSGSLSAPLVGSDSLIDGWKNGLVGMKLGGVREITVPGNLAYADQQEICGGYNKPLKFVIMALEKSEPLATLEPELEEAQMKLYYAYYGIDYDDIEITTEESETDESSDGDSGGSDDSNESSGVSE